MSLEEKLFKYYVLSHHLKEVERTYINYKGTSKEKRHTMNSKIESVCNGLENAIKGIVGEHYQDAVDKAVDEFLDEKIMTLIAEKSDSLTEMLASQMEEHYKNLSQVDDKKPTVDKQKDSGKGKKEKEKESSNTSDNTSIY